MVTWVYRSIAGERHPDDVEQRRGEPGQLLLAAAREGAQVPAGPAHPGDRVVDLVEPPQPFRVVLVGFELVQGGAQLLGQHEQVQPELVADVGPRAVSRPRPRRVRRTRPGGVSRGGSRLLGGRRGSLRRRLPGRRERLGREHGHPVPPRLAAEQASPYWLAGY